LNLQAADYRRANWSRRYSAMLGKNRRASMAKKRQPIGYTRHAIGVRGNGIL
jgi:hypothetical protein